MDRWDWIAQVRASAGKKQYSFSTGVPLSRRFILTTGHGIKGSASVKVRFIADHQTPVWKTWRQAKVVWRGKQGLDAALLQVDKVDDLRFFPYISFRPNGSWHGLGFPAASKSALNEMRVDTGLSGSVTLGGRLTGDIEITIGQPPKDDSKWAGISGAPVVWNDYLIGIIKSLKGKYGGERLSAVPVGALLQDDAFVDLIRQDKDEYFGEVEAQVAAILKDASSLCNSLRRRLAISERDEEKVARSMLEYSSVEELIEAFIELKNGRIGSESQGDLQKLMNRLLPLLHDCHVTDLERLRKGRGGALRLPATTRAVAEIILANAEQRATSYKTPGTVTEDLVGKLCRTTIGRGVLDMKGQEFFEFVEDDLFTLLPPDFSDKKYDKKQDRLRERLRVQARTLNIRHYYVFDEDLDDRFSDQMDKLVELYPEVRFLFLSDSNLRSTQYRLTDLLTVFFAE